MSANHGGDFQRAKNIIREAVNAGADAIKFQVYTADSLTLPLDSKDFVINDKNSLWYGCQLYDLYKEAATPYQWFPELFDYSKSLGITPFASPFDNDAVQLLEELQSPAYKIASFEAVDTELIAACVKTGKPVIISTGMCSEEDIDYVLNIVKENGGTEVAILKCTSAYPARFSEANLVTIPEWTKKYGIPVGISDHTLGTVASVAGCALGAAIVEKHFIDKAEPKTADSEFSLLPSDLKKLVTECHMAAESRGVIHYGPVDREINSLQFRRSLYATKDIKENDVFSRKNIRSVRPGYGLEVKLLPKILGKKASRDIPVGTALTKDLINKF